MSLSKALFAALLIAASLVVSTVATAGRAPLRDGTLSVRDGRGMIQIRMRGSIIGRFGRGSITVTDPVGDGGLVVVRGAERERNVNERTTIYSGANIRFRIADDRRVVVRFNAGRMNFSVVGRGDVWLDGVGDVGQGIFFDGSYSLNGEPYASIPDERTRFELAAPPPSG